MAAAARDAPLWQGALRQQIYLGEKAFVERMQARATAQRLSVPEVPRTQRTTPQMQVQMQTLLKWLALRNSREVALHRTYREVGLTMTAMARDLGLSVARVSQLVSMGQASTQALNSRPDPK